MKTYTHKEIKLKSGVVIPKDTEVEVSFLESNTTCEITYDDNKYIVRITSVFEKPDMETIEDWVNDSGCESVTGEWVEHDGHDKYNAPSWMMVLGII